MPQPKTGSLADLGLQRWTDENKYKYGGYPKLIEMFEGGFSDAEIAVAFGPKDRPISRQAPWAWRGRWELEKKYPELRKGGTLEDVEANRAE